MGRHRKARARALGGGMVKSPLFLRLPVRSLLRFRAVCRSWAATISSDEFCALHMAKPDDDTAPCRLLFVAPKTGYDSTAIQTCSPSGSGPCRVDTLFAIDELRGSFVGPVAAQCRGLTLLYDAVAPAYYILNAATRAVTRLPPCPDVHRSSAGLGYDSRTKEYKAIRLFTQTCYDEQLARYSLHAKCEIYTLTGCGDQWRSTAGAGRGGPSSLFNKATQAALANAAFEKLTPVLANGSLHWLLLPLFQKTCPGVSIMSLSVTEETFGWIRSPPFVTTGAHLVELDGYLCMARDLSTSSSSMLEIWKLQDYSASGVWSLHHHIDLSPSGQYLLPPVQVVRRVIGAIGNGRSGKKKIIVATTSLTHKEVHAYDAMSGTLETTILSSINANAVSALQPMSLLKETLAPVHRTSTEIVLSAPVGKAFKEILLRLPAKSVIQFKAVCTQWRKLVEGETFMRSYIVHRKKMWDKLQGQKMMLVGSKGSAEQSPCFQFIPLEKWLSADTASQAGAWLQAKVVCSKPCHGLNLVSTADEEYIYNPCTGYHKTISYPPCSLLKRPWKMPTYVDDSCRIQQLQQYYVFSPGGSKNIGLGFNPVTQEHVAVIILYQRKDFKSRRYRLTCFVWNRFLQEGPDPPLPPNDMPPAYVDGVLYWMSDPWLGPADDKQALVSFDIARGEFDVVPCPSHISDKNHRGHGCFVVELQGMLCAVLADPMADELEIWKHDHQWDRAYTICLKQWPDYSLVSNGIVVPMSIDPQDGRILLSTGRKVGLYDPAHKTLERLCTLGGDLASNDNKEMNTRSSTTAVPPVPMLYEESLFSYPRVPKRRLLE